MMTRLRAQGNSSSRSRAAAVIKEPCDMIVSDNPDRINNNNNNSKAAASPSTQYQTVVKEKKYDMGGSSTGELIHKCGIHDYETKSIKEFNEHIALHNNDNVTGSKAASVPVNKLQDIIRLQKSNGRL